MERLIVKLLCVLAVSVLLVSCGGGGGGGESTGGGAPKIQLSGTVGTGYTVASAKPQGFFARAAAWFGIGASAYAGAGDPTVDTIVALRVDRGSLTSYSMISGHTATIQPNGAFSLVLEKDYDWVLVLMNSQATGTTSPYVGSVAVNVGSGGGESLLGLPLSAATVGALSLGMVTRSTSTTGTQDALATKQVSTVEFSMTLDQMLALSKTDDVFRNAKNIIANYDRSLKTWYGITPAFTFANSAPVGTAFTAPSSGAFSGYGLQIDTNTTSVAMQNICGVGATKKAVGFYPPVDILATSPATTYGPAIGMTNDGVTACVTQGANIIASDSDFFAGTNTASTEKTISYGFSAVTFPLPLPAGDWLWKEEASATMVTKAAFDLQVSSPSTTSGQQKGFVPSLAVTYDGTTQRVSAVKFAWSYYDEATGLYTAVSATSIGVLKHVARVVELGIYEVGHDTDTVEKIQFDPAAASSVAPTHQWSYGAAGGMKQIDHINLYYETGGIARVVIFNNFP